MSDRERPNPPLRIGAPVPSSSLGELKEHHAQNLTLRAFLIDIGHWYYRESSGDRDNEQRKRSQDRDR
jgi:hypothetical protein